MTTKELFARVMEIPDDAWPEIFKAVVVELSTDDPDYADLQVSVLRDNAVLRETDSPVPYVYLGFNKAAGYGLEIFTNGNARASWYGDSTPVNIPALIEGMTKAMEEIKP